MNELTKITIYFVLVGLAIVLVGLAHVVLLYKIKNALEGKTECVAGGDISVSVPTPVSAPASAPAPVPEIIPNRAELVAVVSAVIAEEIGADASSIRILSMKKL